MCTDEYGRIVSRLSCPSQHSLRVYGAFPPKEVMDLSDPETGFIVQYKECKTYEARVGVHGYGR
eukprot:191358-Amorphochlora_amoeboformis.AAC.1